MSVVAQHLNFSFRPLFLEIREEDMFSPPGQIEQRNAGVQPVGIIGSGLTGSGGQPDPVQVGGGGN
jgi:hypothetical protein